MSKPNLTLHTDPGHGWLEVDWTDLKAVGLNPSDFSAYSYRNGNTFYLEEDCDATLFLSRIKTKTEVVTLHVNHSHPIRTYKGIHE